jgi:hypothetical protein
VIAEAESLLEGGRIKSMPAWDRVLRRDLLDQAVRG